MPAHAQDSSVLRDGLFGSSPNASRRAPTPMVARYVAETGDEFILDRSGSRPLLRFADSYEVWALQPQAAPRGDTIYKNDLGQPVLRATKLGGLTLFTRERPEGAAVAVAGESGPIRLAPMSPSTLLSRLAQASAKASRAAQKLISVGADATPQSAALIADAASVAAEALVRMSHTSHGKAALAKIDKIFVAQGKRPDVGVNEGVLIVTVRPDLGIAGRPSSERIAHSASGAR
ncbi:MAG TPA: DUF4908 domain-containing protein [Caulobacteraceae bacterium]